MARALLRLTVAAGTPPLRLDGRLAPFGCWLREQVASLVPDWPAVGFHRIEITQAGVELLLVAGSHADPRAQFLAVLRAVERRTERGAIRSGWSRSRLWCDVEIIG
jgi:hypothetical protein